jgi:amino acid adenylation domain-containing protein
MSTTKMMTCGLIGTTTLLLRCAAILKEQGQDVAIIISADENIINWCQQHGINHSKNIEDLRHHHFEYLFSIVNPYFLPQKILSLAKKLALNYHDSSLPKYAGIHATSWAILNGEKKHAITWHCLSNLIDGGDVLIQSHFDLDARDTALTLNLKCYEHASMSFISLLKALKTGVVNREKQNLFLRSYYSPFEKPPANGFINWNCTAKQIEELYRALKFGDYANTFSLPKILLKNKIVIPSKMQSLTIKSSSSAGTITVITKHSFQVATLTFDIAVEGITDLRGKILPIPATMKTLQLNVDDRITLLEPLKQEYYKKIAETFAPFEAYWLTELKDVRENRLIFRRENGIMDGSAPIALWKINYVSNIVNAAKNKGELFFHVILYLSQMLNEDSLTVKFSHPDLISLNTEISELYNIHVPFNFAETDRLSIYLAKERVLGKLIEHLKSHSFSKDIYQRYPDAPDTYESLPILIAFSHSCPELLLIDETKIVFNIIEAEDKLELSCVVAPDIKPEVFELIQEMGSQIKDYISAAAENNETLIADFNFLYENEKKRSVVNSNVNDKHKRDYTISDLFDAVVQSQPDSIAIVDYKTRITYRELSRLIEITAALITEKFKEIYDSEINPSEIISVHARSGKHYVIFIFAILKLGCAYSPVDPDYPVDRKKYLIANCKSKIVITDEDKAQLTEIDAAVISLDINKIKQAPYHPIPNSRGDIIYVLHTSGSTGKPKGATVKQESFINLLNWYNKLGPAQSIRTLVTTSFSFDLTQKNIFAPLVFGGELHFKKQNAFYDSEEVLEHIYREKIQHINCTPAMFYPLIATSEKITKLCSLKYIVFGGESFNGAKFKFLFQKLPKLNLYNTYGPTECTDVCAYYKVTPHDIVKGNNIPIGLPIDNTQILILDKNLKCLPRGQIGELAVSGIGLATGYINDTTTTSKKFLKIKPFSTKNTELMIYRTGDLARVLSTGNIEFINRVDHQVKINGYRIEPGEIAAALNTFADVLESSVIVKNYPQSDIKKLLAFLVPIDKDNCLPANKNKFILAVREFLANQLPNYMMPPFFMVLEALPLNKHGKVDTDKLLTLEEQNEAVILPKDKIESDLLELTTKILSIETKIQDNFFSIGGDSLTAVRLAAAIVKQFSINISLQQIYENALLFRMADLIRQTKIIKKPKIKKTSPKMATKLIPATAEQKRFGYIYQAYPNSRTAYNLPIIHELDGELSVHALQFAFNKIIAEDEILRTCFKNINGDIFQSIESESFLKINRVDFITRDEAMKFIHASYHEAFDLACLPLMRVYPIYINETCHTLLFINMHHIIGDGQTSYLLLQRISSYYNQYTNKYPINDLKPSSQYQEYAHWQKKYLKSAAYKKKWEHYRNYLHNIVPLDLPSKTTTVPDSLSGKTAFFTLSQQQMAKLKALALANNTSLFIVLFSIFAIELNYYTQQENITVAAPVSTRASEKFRTTLGLFINTLILRADINLTKHFTELLKSISKRILQAYDYRDIPYDQVVSLLRKTHPAPNGTPVNVFFELISPDYLGELSIPGMLSKSIADVDFHVAKFNLTLRVLNGEMNSNACIEYNTEIFDAGFIQGFIQHFLELVNLITQHPEEKLINLVPLTVTEKKLFFNIKGHNSLIPLQNNFFDLFYKTAKANPASIAVKDKLCSLSYEELLNSIFQYAAWLKSVGVNNKTPVAVILDRDIRLVCVLLSLIYLDITFIPIDIELKQNKINYFIENSDVKYVIQNQHTALDLPENIDSIYIEQMNCKKFKLEQYNFLTSKMDYLAYIIYTSGSTGVPKGVSISYNALSNILVALRNKLKLTDTDHFLFSTSSSFDIALAELLLPLITGACCYVADKNLLKEPEKLNAVLAENNLKVMQGTPSLWQALLSTNWQYSGRLKILCGGELLSVGLASALLSRSNELYNLYGPTETTIWATVYQVHNINENGEYSIPIGIPLEGVEVYVLDKYKRPVPINVVGELYIGGIGISTGYYNNKISNKQKFITNPFPYPKSTRLFRTGDLVKWLENGNLQFIGRNDRQIKLGGYRIELDEIETIIKQYSNIDQCAVIFDKERNQIVALINFKAKQPLTKSDPSKDISLLKEFLRDKLAIYQLPGKFQMIRVLPLNSNGKTDYKALQENLSQHIQTEIFKPQLMTDIHKQIIQVWQNLLKSNEINLNENFFVLGGNSFLAIEMISQLSEILKMNLTVTMLFQYPSINTFVDYIQNKMNDQEIPPLQINNILFKRKQLTADESI